MDNEVRDGIARAELLLCYALIAYEHSRISEDVMDLYRENSIDEILGIDRIAWLSADQTLPENPYEKAEWSSLRLVKRKRVREGMEIMLNANFKRIE